MKLNKMNGNNIQNKVVIEKIFCQIENSEEYLEILYKYQPFV